MDYKFSKLCILLVPIKTKDRDFSITPFFKFCSSWISFGNIVECLPIMFIIIYLALLKR